MRTLNPIHVEILGPGLFLWVALGGYTIGLLNPLVYFCAIYAIYFPDELVFSGILCCACRVCASSFVLFR